jgi:hypothetical protein
MRFSLKEEWQNKMIVKIKIYSLNTNDKKMINDIFNRFQTQNKLKFIIAATSFAYSVFVIWTVKDDVRKNKVIVNIRDLNALLISDAYLVSSQSEIIDDLFECKYLSMLDVNTFFYQWRVHSNDVYKQTVMTHRKQKIFLVFIMKNRNSIAYVQRQMNILLNDLKKFVKMYIDDIICKSRLTAGLNFEHVEQFDSIQISNRTWLFVRRVESNLICCSTFEFDSYKLFEILD